MNDRPCQPPTLPLLALLLLLGLAACGPTEGEQQPADPEPTGGTQANPEDFDAFYARFHTDSAFQMQRVRFPLPGEHTEAKTEEASSEMGQPLPVDTSRGEGTPSVYWTAERWEMQTEELLDTTRFEVKWQRRDSLVRQQVYVPNSGFAVARTFQRIDGKWYLVYYENDTY